MKSDLIIWALFIIQNYLIVSDEINTEYECPRNLPLLPINSSKNECVCEPYNDTYIVSNKIIKNQWLNKMNQIGESLYCYMTYDFSSKGDLIIESLKFWNNLPFSDRYFYGIKSNGRPLFYDQENNKFINQIYHNSTSSIAKYESQMIRIKLTNDDDKDYYLSSCFERNTIDIIDFYNKRVIGNSQLDLLGYSTWSSKFYTILELKNEDKVYMFCFIGCKDNIDYISLQKFQFNSPNISEKNSYNKISSSPENEAFHVYSSFTLTCIEISKYNLIQCFYLNSTGNYTIGLFKEDTLEFLCSINIDEAPHYITENERFNGFYRSIYLKDEISILAYMLDKTPDCIYIQLKNLVYNKYALNYELEDCLIEYKKIEVKIEGSTKFNSFYYISDLKKINNNKFSLISAYDYNEEEAFDLYIILFDIYNFHDTNLSIRYYYIQMKLYNYRIYRFILSIKYNGFLGLIYSVRKIKKGDYYQKFSIFSYINSTDSELIYLDINSVLKLNEYINNENVENNIFGVDFYGIKIIKLPSSKETGVYFFSKKENKTIFENDILSPEDEICFVYDYNSLRKGNEVYTIEMAGIVQEKEYSKAIEFTIHNKFYGADGNSAENYYKRKIYIGRTSFYNYTIPNTLNGSNVNTCTDNCQVCYNGTCLKCQEEFNLIEDTNKCQNLSPGNNYYFDENYNIYKRCHEFCKNCSQGPKNFSDILEIEDTNCIECIEDYYKIENTNNCINKNNIPETYYFDYNKEKICKCFENCRTCNQSQLNSTYYSCLSCDKNSILYKNSGNCLNCYSKGKYANHYENECIDFIPEGYYLEDEETKALGKCFFSCKKCEALGDSNDHKCTECGENYPYRDKDGTKCLENCSIEYMYNLFYLNEGKKICLENDSCPTEYSYLKPGTLECSKCYYNYKGECYSSCPNNTFINQTIDDINICIDIINEPITEIETKFTTDILTNIITENKVKSIDSEGQIKSDKFFEFSIILDKIENLNNKNNIVINDNPNITINIYMYGLDIDEIEDSSNLTFIDLEECGEKLKKFYNLDSNENLYIVSYESPNYIENRATNEYKYEIYLKNGTELKDLSTCNNISISVSSSIIDLDLINYEEAQIFSLQGYNIYNLSSEFYTDLCSSANINGNDIVLKDRIEDIFPKNVTFCSNGCELDKVEIKSKRIKCNCAISYDEEINNNQTSENKLKPSDDNFLVYLLDNVNYKVFGCYKILFKLKFKILIKNIGFFFGIVFLLFNIICFFIFSCYYLPQLRIQIFKFLPENEYLLKGKKSERLPKRKTKTNNAIYSKKIFSRNNCKRKIKAIKLNGRKSNANKTKTKKISKNKKEASTYISKIEEKDYNILPYSQAIKFDKRNIFSIFLSIMKMKIDIISILFYPEEFTHKSLTFCIYTLDFLISFFINALLYTDDVISEKYHNNGKLETFTTLFLSITSNIISFIIMYIIKRLAAYSEVLSRMVRDVKKKNEYILAFKKVYLVIKIKVFSFFYISFILSLFVSIYLSIFCHIYTKIQSSLIISYLMGLIESLAYSIGIPLIICILRYFGLKRKSIYAYRTSVYLDDLL